MSTRSNSIVQRKDGKFARIYVHFDGYLQGVGRILREHFQNPAKVEKLVALGDLSSLAPKITKPKGHSFSTPKKGYTVAYGRDRGETKAEAKVFDTLAAALPAPESWVEFVYIFLPEGAVPNRVGWFVVSASEGTQTMIPLDVALTGKVAVNAPIKVFGMTVGTHRAGA